MYIGFNLKITNVGAHSEARFWPAVQTVIDCMCVFKCGKVLINT